MHHDQATELQQFNSARVAADSRVRRAEQELGLAKTEAQRAALRYKRCALWIRADELRKELATVEQQAANITLPKENS